MTRCRTSLTSAVVAVVPVEVKSIVSVPALSVKVAKTWPPASRADWASDTANDAPVWSNPKPSSALAPPVRAMVRRAPA